MIQLRPFRPADLLDIRTHQRYRDAAREAYVVLNPLRPLAYAWTAVSLRGDHYRPIACCGIERGLAWAFVSPEMTPHQALAVTRAVRRVLRRHSSDRGPVIALIDPDFYDAVRWASLLGFARVEGTNKWVYDDQLS